MVVPNSAQIVRPSAMDTAVWLMRGGAAYVVVSATISYALTFDSDVASRSRLGVDSLAPDAAARLVLAEYVLGVAVGYALWIWMAWANGQGKSWARIVAIVLACLAVIPFIANLVILLAGGAIVEQSGGVRVVQIVMTIGQQIISASALWFMYRPESGAFYAVRSAPHIAMTAYPPYQYGAPNRYGQPYRMGSRIRMGSRFLIRLSTDGPRRILKLRPGAAVVGIDEHLRGRTPGAPVH